MKRKKQNKTDEQLSLKWS